MTDLRKLLETLEDYVEQALAQHDQQYQRHPSTERDRQVIVDDLEALRQALAEPEQKPVGTYEGVMEAMLSLRSGTLEQQQVYGHMKDKLLYTAPPKREWVGLTGLEQKELMAMNSRYAVFETEAKLKEKNT